MTDACFVVSTASSLLKSPQLLDTVRGSQRRQIAVVKIELTQIDVAASVQPTSK
jgi:hypothetical protein